MRNIVKNLYPQGKKFALTMSYDDGTIFDRPLVEMFNRYNIKGTFHLNSSAFGKERKITPEEVKTLYRNHEVSCHTYTHPFPSLCSDTILVDEIMEDRRVLEQLCGYTVRGMSYPFGDVDDRVVAAYRACGMKYARTTIAASTRLPHDFMRWNPTCHDNPGMKDIFDNMVNTHFPALQCMYIWGHSYEFDTNNSWDMMEEFCKYASGNENVWYATNIEIYDYVTALRNLEIGADRATAYNSSNLDLWISVDGEKCCIKPGYSTF